jgi:hypothetical protein
MPGGWGVPCVPVNQANLFIPIGDAQGCNHTGNPTNQPAIYPRRISRARTHARKLFCHIGYFKGKQSRLI